MYILMYIVACGEEPNVRKLAKVMVMIAVNHALLVHTSVGI